MDLVVFRIHQEGERHLEGVDHFGFVDPEIEARLHFRQRRQDAEAERGAVEIEIADRLDELALQAHFLAGLAQRGIHRRGIGGVDLAAGKGNLPGMAAQVRRTLRQQHGRLGMIDHGDQYRCGAHRLLLRHDLQHAVIAGIAGARNDIGIDQPGRNVEIEPRPRAVEKFRSPDGGGPGCQHLFVQRAFLTCSASAIAKNSPPNSTPNISSPSIIRSSPMSTRS